MQWATTIGKLRVVDKTGLIISDYIASLEQWYTFIGGESETTMMTEIRNQDLSWIQDQTWRYEDNSELFTIKLGFLGGDNKYLWSELCLNSKFARCPHCFTRFDSDLEGYKIEDKQKFLILDNTPSDSGSRTMAAHIRNTVEFLLKLQEEQPKKEELANLKATHGGCTSIPLFARNNAIDLKISSF
jgi:hypothetical protein